MTRQCAWCDCYLSIETSEPYVTHGICEGCAARLRQAMPVRIAPITPHAEEIRPSTTAPRLDGVLVQ